MNWFQRLFAKAATRLFTFAPAWVRYAFTEFTTRALVQEGYKKNSAVSACATTLQLTFPEPPLLAGYEEEGRFVPDYTHEINKLLKQPNPDMGMAEFLQFAITYNPIGGNCYIWKQRSKSRKVVAWWPFSDINFNPVAGHNMLEGFVSYYEFDPGDGKLIQVPKEDVIHWKWMIDPEYPWKGIGAIALSARDVDKDSEATAYIFALLKNNAVPATVITLEEDDDSTQEELDTMGLKWKQKHARGQPAFITHGMKVEQMGFDLHKLAADTLADIPETRIAANFKVPPSVAGLNVGVKRSDYGDTAARKAYTEQTLMALWRSLASELLNGMKDEYPGTPHNFTLQFDLRSVGALQEQKKDQWLRVTDAFNRGLLTRAQSKMELGMIPDKSDNVYFVSLASEFVPAGDAVVRQPSVASDPPSGTSQPAPQKRTWRGEEKSKRDGMRKAGRLLQRVRLSTAVRMEAAVDQYFDGLGESVAARAKKSLVISRQSVKSNLPNANDLLNDNDKNALAAIVKRFYIEIVEASWQGTNAMLGVDIAFDLGDPLVAQILQMAEVNVQTIHSYTLAELNNALANAAENGWSIDQLVRGDAGNGIPGLRDIIEETYKDRARVIARTELGEAQNSATAMRYENAGVELVEILDNGDTDDDTECQEANGQVWALDYFTDHLLEHPNCTRCAVPYFGKQEPDRS